MRRKKFSYKNELKMGAKFFLMYSSGTTNYDRQAYLEF